MQVTAICKMAKIRPTINEIELHPFLAQHKFVAWNASMVSTEETRLRVAFGLASTWTEVNADAPGQQMEKNSVLL